MKKMIRFTALALLAVSMLASRSMRRDNPTPECIPDCQSKVLFNMLKDNPTPECIPNCNS